MGFLDEPYQPNLVARPSAPAQQMPYGNLVPKLQQEQMGKDVEDYRKRQEVLSSAIQNYNSLLPEFKKFSDINKQVPTGGFGLKLQNAIPGLDTTMSPEEQTMIAIQNKLTPLQRPPGSGATSNFEEQMYLKSVPNIGFKGNANKAIAQSAYDKYYDILGYNKYMNDYFKQNGSLQGVDDKWGQYQDVYVNQAKKDNPRYADMTSTPKPKTKGEKQGDILLQESNKSVLDSADAILKGSKGGNF
jgi:hypothetical protein